MAPSYLSDLLTIYSPPRVLRPSSKKLVTVPFSKTVSHGDKAFSVAAPKLWNNLPLFLRSSDSSQNFKSNLKTYILKLTYS